MTWFKIDDNFFMHPKVIAAGNAAVGLFVRAGAWSSNHLTDGFIPEPVANMLGTDKDATNLIVAGLWVAVEGGYRIPDFLDYNPSAQAVKAEQARRSEAAKVAGAASAKARSTIRPTIRQRSANDDVDESLTTSLNDRCADVATSPEPRPDPTRSKTPPTPQPVLPVDNSAGGGGRIELIINAYVAHQIEQAKRTSAIRNETAYRKKLTDKARLHPQLKHLAAMFPTAPPDAIAAAMHGEKHSLAYYPRADELADVVELRPA
jgi:hypothetical protein